MAPTWARLAVVVVAAGVPLVEYNGSTKVKVLHQMCMRERRKNLRLHVWVRADRVHQNDLVVHHKRSGG